MAETHHTVTLSQVLLRGLGGKCPGCGGAKIFHAFLKPAAACAACGEEFHHQRADDFPAYIVVVLVGHIVVSLAVIVEKQLAPPFWVHAALWTPLVLTLTIGLLQPVKGAVIALQWHMGLHGFSDAKKRRDGKAGKTV